jgi:hypothetical protein
MVTKTTRVQFDKVINGQTISFGYEYGAKAPEQISINVPLVTSSPDGKQFTNGSGSISIQTENLSDAIVKITSHLSDVLAAMNDVLTNYQNPEGV